MLHSRRRDDIENLVAAHLSLCSKAGMESLAEADIEAYPRAVITTAIIDDPTLR